MQASAAKYPYECMVWYIVRGLCSAGCITVNIGGKPSLTVCLRMRWSALQQYGKASQPAMISMLSKCFVCRSQSLSLLETATYTRKACIVCKLHKGFKRLSTYLADGLTFWTDGLYKSTYHRVRAPKEGDHLVRLQTLSFALFLHTPQIITFERKQPQRQSYASGTQLQILLLVSCLRMICWKIM